MKLPDCGDNSCRYMGSGRGGMRTNGGCRCDRCPTCDAYMRNPGFGHRDWCEQKEWRPFWDTDAGRKALEERR